MKSNRVFCAYGLHLLVWHAITVACTVDVVSSLTQRLRAAKGDRSIDDIARRANSRGHRLSRSTVAKYLRDEQGDRPPAATVDALAAGFDLDPREVRRLAGMPRGELGEWIPPAESASLTRDQRTALDQLIKSMVATGGSSDDRHHEVRGDPLEVAGQGDMTRAARSTGEPKGIRIREQDEAGEENQDPGGWEGA